MKQHVPVLNMQDFGSSPGGLHFYADRLPSHLKNHPVTARPHKHDFFVTVLFTHGSGTHEVDFNTYRVKPGAVFLLVPGQAHHWQLSKDVDGFIFFHTRSFFDEGFTQQRLRDFSFFNSLYSPPLVSLNAAGLRSVEPLFSTIYNEWQNAALMKNQKLLSLISLLYIELARLQPPTVAVKSENYMDKLRHFEDLLDKQFKAEKLPSVYAEQMHMTERHLNRICKTCLDKTPTALILDRVMLEARRLLTYSNGNVSETAATLGYDDPSYFSKLFKKNTGVTPKAFVHGLQR